MKIKCPYTYPHKSREAKVNYLTGIGGYYSRDGRFPIEFTVGTYYTKLDFDTLWTHILREFRAETEDEDENRLFKEACAKVYCDIKDYLFDWGLEDARRDIDPRETDTYHMLWDGTMLNTVLELHGRGGKHLVIVEFEGLRLEGYSEEALHEALMLQEGPDGEEVTDKAKLKKGYEWSVSPDLVDKLYRYVRQCEIDFTSEKASSQVECCAAWHVYNRAEDEVETMRKKAQEKQALQSEAKLLYDALDMSDEELREAWRDLCVAAGLTPSDIMY